MGLVVVVVSVLGFLYNAHLLYKFRFLYSETPRLKYLYGLLALFWLTLFFSALFRDNYLLLASFCLLISHWILRLYSRRKSATELQELVDEMSLRQAAAGPDMAEDTPDEITNENEISDQEFMEIVTAIASGDIELAKEKLSSDFDVNYISTETDSQLLPLLLQQGQGELILKTAEKITNNSKYTEEERQEYREMITQHEKFESGCLLLLSLKAEVNAKDANGRSNVMLASKHGFVTALEQLIRLGADLDYQRYDGTTALHEAVRARAIKATGLLVAAGAATDLENRDGKVALDFARDEAIIAALGGS